MTIEQIRELAGDKRSKTFGDAIMLCHQRNFKSFVETGCFRGSPCDGMSTIIIGNAAKDLLGLCHSVDKDPVHIARAQKATEGLPVMLHQSDSVEWLSRFKDPIDFLYLDSYDYLAQDPIGSQVHQLAELGAAYGKLTPNSVILLDDCNLEGGGKGALATRFLAERGWNIVVEEYQRLLTR